MVLSYFSFPPLIGAVGVTRLKRFINHKASAALDAAAQSGAEGMSGAECMSGAAVVLCWAK